MPVLVYGAGGHGKVVRDALEAAGRRVLGFLDDDPGRFPGGYVGLPVHDAARLAEAEPGAEIVVAVGDGAVRERLTRRVRDAGRALCTVVHPTASVAPDVELGEGCMILAQAAVNPDAELGEGVIVNTGATVDHDCRIGAFVHLAPGVHLAGEVTVGARTLVGVGAVVVPGVRIGADVVVGAGAAVVRDVPDGVVVVGVPARVVRRIAGADAEAHGHWDDEGGRA